MDYNQGKHGSVYWRAMCLSSCYNQISWTSRLLLIRCVRPFYNRFFTDTLYQGEQCTVIASAGGHTKYWNKLNITCIDIAFCFLFRVFMLILSVKFVDMIKLHRSFFYILGIICIKHIFGYLYFSHNAFPKIW